MNGGVSVHQPSAINQDEAVGHGAAMETGELWEGLETLREHDSSSAICIAHWGTEAIILGGGVVKKREQERRGRGECGKVSLS